MGSTEEKSSPTELKSNHFCPKHGRKNALAQNLLFSFSLIKLKEISKSQNKKIRPGWVGGKRMTPAFLKGMESGEVTTRRQLQRKVPDSPKQITRRGIQESKAEPSGHHLTEAEHGKHKSRKS